MKHGSICNNCKLFITINSLLIPPSIWVKSKDYSNLWINLLSKDSALFLLVSLILIHWIVIYPIDNAIQCLNNWTLTPVTQMDNDINWINHYPADKAILFSLQYLSTRECFIL